VLHTGDFRACDYHTQHAKLTGRLDVVYLDTTYLNSKYTFPPQETILDQVGDLCRRLQSGHVKRNHGQSILLKWMGKQVEEKMLFVVGTYTIGKERVFIRIPSL
jgi:DNA cross-link repair 1A protein